jgi:hypothetical protein
MLPALRAFMSFTASAMRIKQVNMYQRLWRISIKFRAQQKKNMSVSALPDSIRQ